MEHYFAKKSQENRIPSPDCLHEVKAGAPIPQSGRIPEINHVPRREVGSGSSGQRGLKNLSLIYFCLFLTSHVGFFKVCENCEDKRTSPF